MLKEAGAGVGTGKVKKSNHNDLERQRFEYSIYGFIQDVDQKSNYTARRYTILKSC